MYNQNESFYLCRNCDEEPAVYNGLCETCLTGDEKDPDSGKFQLRHRPHKRLERRNYDPED